MQSPASRDQTWPELALEAWSETCATLHMWTQIVGKIRLTQSPWINHSWHVTLYVTPRGLTTSPIPYGTRTFQIDFDFINHQLIMLSSDGGIGSLPLQPQSVAAFYQRLMEEMARLDLHVDIHTTPNEVADPIRFDRDESHRAYDAEYANRFWRILVQADRVFKEFRVRFIGKCSPVHFFWGAPDLAVTRFSGRRAPQHPGGVPHLPDRVTREAYSHEVSSCGFWPGGGAVPYPAFYSYAYPEPEGFSKSPVKPQAAFYSTELREFILPYDAVRASPTPDETLLDFLQTTYEAAADLGGWDRQSLERSDADVGMRHVVEEGFGGGGGDLFEALHTLRSVRHFRPDPLPHSTLRAIIEAATRAPSARNAQPWYFLAVQDPDVKRAIAALYLAAWQQAQRYTSAVDADADIKERPGYTQMMHSVDTLATHLDRVPVIVLALLDTTQLGPMADGHGTILAPQSAYASIFPAVQNLMLAARGLGVGSTLTTVFSSVEAEIRNATGIPPHLHIAALVPLGYPQRPFRVTKRKPLDAVMFLDRWGQKLGSA